MLAAIATDRLGAYLRLVRRASTHEGRPSSFARACRPDVPLLPLVSSDPDWLSALGGTFGLLWGRRVSGEAAALRGGFQALSLRIAPGC